MIIDCTGQVCPLPLLHTKAGLNKLSKKQVVEVITTDPTSLKDIPFFIEKSGHHLLEIKREFNGFRFFIKK